MPLLIFIINWILIASVESNYLGLIYVLSLSRQLFKTN